jgi:SAM-dependent methyltransferase
MMDFHKINFSIQNWRHQERLSNSVTWKLVLYDLIRPFLSRYAKRYLTAETLNIYDPDFVLLERGFPLQTRRKWALKGMDLSGKTILIQGAGSGWEIISWAIQKPKRILAVDLFYFKNSWSEIRTHCQDFFDVEVNFIQGSLDNLGFLKGESIDFCASDAVYEHCQNLSYVVAETLRVLKPGGIVYSSYGPLWFCAAGDHYARGGLESAYNHLLLDSASYEAYYRDHLLPDEDFQSGGRYITLNLFSHLRTAEYIRIFEDSGFNIINFGLEISSLALKFQNTFPEKYNFLVNKYSGICDEDDFRIKGNFVRLQKPVFMPE